MTTDTQRGGARKGAGRPKILENRQRITVTLSESDLDWLLGFALDKQLTGVSAAVRKLIEESQMKS